MIIELNLKSFMIIDTVNWFFFIICSSNKHVGQIAIQSGIQKLMSLLILPILPSVVLIKINVNLNNKHWRMYS